MKRCNKCGRELDESMFHKNRESKDGLTSFCKDCRNRLNKLYYENNPDVLERKKQYSKMYRETHKQQRKEYMDKYSKRPEVQQQRNNYNMYRYNTDIKFKMDNSMINACSRVLSGRTKVSDVLPQKCGYTAEDLRKHIESQFTSEMNWSNYGIYWELDHITPRFKFYYESYNDEQFKQCWALNNLRPLKIIVNRCRSKV